MKNILLKRVILISKGHPYHDKVVDILIQDGKIASIEKNIKPTGGIEVFQQENAHVSIGWMDIGVQIGEPGYEHREDLETVTQAALKGGFTEIAAYPNTNPVIQSKTSVKFLASFSKHNPVKIYAIGALTEDCSGEAITEMYDMHHAGAVAFSDGKHSIQSAAIMLRSLEYVKAFDGLVINQPMDYTLSKNGMMHEGVTSTKMGVQGISSIAEEIIIERDLNLLKYTDSRLHISNISTEAGLKLIKKAKKARLNVTTSVSVMNIAFMDSELLSFDPMYKVLPPLREKLDMKSLRVGIQSKEIDLINSNHVPIEEEGKKLEFSYAKFGAIGLETCFALANTALRRTVHHSQIVHLLSVNPRKILGLPIPKIEVGAKANLTIYNPDLKWTVTKDDFGSKSLNTPLLGKKLVGKVLGVIS